MKPPVKVAFATGDDERNRELVARMREHFPELPLYVVSEFASAADGLPWIPYHVNRGLLENLSRCRAALQGKRLRLAGVVLQPKVPYRRMRLIALLLAPRGFLAYNENFGSFMLRPRCAGTILRHLLWRAANFLRWQLHPGGPAYTFAWRLARPHEWAAPLLYRAARLAGAGAMLARLAAEPPPSAALATGAPAGVSVVVPSRNGRELLETLLPGLLRELEGIEGEVMVVDNGSSDGTGEFLRSRYPAVRIEHSAEPLSFSRAVNRGIRQARFSHVCLLNNDMVLEPGFFAPLLAAFAAVPDLFCATAQILFPPGVRREETGKAVMAWSAPSDFPVRCDEPIPGEDLSYVLYGSGGCSLYDAARLRALGGVNEAYEPAYVEDLDLGYRAWQRGWPTVFVAGARVEHRHRATTSRYYTEEQLTAVLEINYLRFLGASVAAPAVFRRLWRHALRRLYGRALKHEPAALAALAAAPRAALDPAVPPHPAWSEDLLLALANGSVAVFPGRPASGRPRVLVASPYLPFPLSHGGAVRVFNLMRRAAAEFDQVLVAFADALAPPAAELLEFCCEIVLVLREGTHSLPSSRRPDVVEEFDSLSFRAALRQTVRKWRPAVAQLEFTQMAQYAADCVPAPTILVEHDITLDLFEQLAALDGDWDTRRQLERWRAFETAAWQQVDRVVAMSAQDAARVGGCAVVLPNGVDLERFQPPAGQPEPRRLLFIGSFAHLPNLLALRFFLDEVWPRLGGCTLHVIAGARPDYFLDRWRDRVTLRLDLPGIEREGFVADVRPAYRRAEIVVAPLAASAGTNIKILEALAMGKAVVSTPAGVNGLDLCPGRDYVSARTGPEMAAAIEKLCASPERRQTLEKAARCRAEAGYDWAKIAQSQKRLYLQIIQGQAT